MFDDWKDENRDDDPDNQVMPQKTESTFIVNSLCFLYKEQGQDLGYHGWLFFALYIYGLL